LNLKKEDPLAIEAVEAIRNGHVDALKHLLAENPGLATARIVEKSKNCLREASRTLLHVAADWPGHFPNGAATVSALISCGADVNAAFGGGPNAETALHWAASSDDIAVLDALLDAGADIEARGAVIGGGTALADATAFGQWRAARRLIERGARSTLWESAALGLMDRIERYFSNERAPGPDEITAAFWGACHGAQLAAAEYLLRRGANINWIGYDRLTPLDAAIRSNADEVAEWLRGEGAKSAKDLNEPR
jgi:uncharacterized protein